MKAITLLQPQKIVFGTGCIQTFRKWDSAGSLC